MDFSFTTEQQSLRASLQAFLRDHYSFEMRRAAVRSDAGWRRAFWQGLGRDLGVLGAALPERCGGSGGGAVETMIVMEELGSALVVEPYLETCVIAGGLLARAGGARADEVLARIAAGDEVIAFAWAEPDTRQSFANINTTAHRTGDGWRLSGRKAVVVVAPWASQLLVTARTAGNRGDAHGVSLFLVDTAAAGIRLIAYSTVDGRRAADVLFDEVMLPAEALIGAADAALPLIEHAGDTAIAALCAEALGVMRRLYGDTVEYCRQRRQFGQFIGSFQVLQHRMVDMYLQIEMAASAACLATLSLDSPPHGRALAASTAKVVVAQACRFVAQNAVQLHGGMGMTEELPVGSYFKRATVIEYEFGTVDYHLAQHARLERAAT